jgi:hypothetical protein
LSTIVSSIKQQWNTLIQQHHKSTPPTLFTFKELETTQPPSLNQRNHRDHINDTMETENQTTSPTHNKRNVSKSQKKMEKKQKKLEEKAKQKQQPASSSTPAQVMEVVEEKEGSEVVLLMLMLMLILAIA